MKKKTAVSYSNAYYFCFYCVIVTLFKVTRLTVNEERAVVQQVFCAAKLYLLVLFVRYRGHSRFRLGRTTPPTPRRHADDVPRVK